MEGIYDKWGSFKKNSNTFWKKIVTHSERKLSWLHNKERGPKEFNTHMICWKQKKQREKQLTYLMSLCECLTEQGQRRMVKV